MSDKKTLAQLLKQSNGEPQWWVWFIVAILLALIVVAIVVTAVVLSKKRTMELTRT